VTPAAQHLMTRLLQLDPRNRPTAAALLFEMSGTVTACPMAAPDQQDDAALSWDAMQNRVQEELAEPLRPIHSAASMALDSCPDIPASELQTPEYWPSAPYGYRSEYAPKTSTPLSIHELHTPEVWPVAPPLR